jgi:c-di-GMP-binding flagellar brake protein YcgR
MALFNIRRGETRDQGAGLDPGLHFAINDHVKLEYKGNFYSSRVEDLRGDDLWVAWPLSSGRDLGIREGEGVTLVGSVRTNLITFECRVEGRDDRRAPLMKVRLRRFLGNLQRRDYVRIPDRLPVAFWVEENAQAFQQSEGVTRDVSGGGLSMLVERTRAPEVDVTVGFVLDLTEDGTVTARGQVMRVESTERRSLCKVVVRYTRMLEADRKRVIRHVNARQTALQKRGLI